LTIAHIALFIKNAMNDSFHRYLERYMKSASPSLWEYYARITTIILVPVLILGMIIVLPIWFLFGFPWLSSPGPLRLFRDHEAEITVYAQRALAGEVGNQPDALNHLLLEKDTPSYGVNWVHIVDHCLEVDFSLPWFDGPLWSLIYIPTMTKDAEKLIHPKAEYRMKLLDYKDLGHGWHYVSQDFL
jgi:hypothetical protein